ncbi:MAG: hypothetical protein KC496_09290 [Anaerolineae bacterium]|nr:hypothetical protein [Anaerolineae bacterium]
MTQQTYQLVHTLNVASGVVHIGYQYDQPACGLVAKNPFYKPVDSDVTCKHCLRWLAKHGRDAQSWQVTLDESQQVVPGDARLFCRVYIAQISDHPARYTNYSIYTGQGVNFLDTKMTCSGILSQPLHIAALFIERLKPDALDLDHSINHEILPESLLAYPSTLDIIKQRQDQP